MKKIVMEEQNYITLCDYLFVKMRELNQNAKKWKMTEQDNKVLRELNQAYAEFASYRLDNK